MIYIFKDGRILYDERLLKPNEEGKYLVFETMPEIPPVKDQVGVITGCNLETGELMIEYFDLPVPEPTPIEPIPEEPIPEEPTPPPLSPTEQAILQTAITTEYMAAMMETTI